MLYSYNYRYFTLLTIWTSTYIEKFFLKFLNIVYLKIGIFPFCCMIIDGVDHLSVTYFSAEPVLSVAITTKLQVCKQGRFSSNSFLRQFLPCMLHDWRYVYVELVRKDRDIRQHRQVRQTLFILTEVGNLISNIFVDIAIWSFF